MAFRAAMGAELKRTGSLKRGAIFSAVVFALLHAVNFAATNDAFPPAYVALQIMSGALVGAVLYKMSVSGGKNAPQRLWDAVALHSANNVAATFFDPAQRARVAHEPVMLALYVTGLMFYSACWYLVPMASPKRKGA